MSKDVTAKKPQMPAKVPAELNALFESQMQGTDADSFAIPFIKILQSNSPWCVPSKAEYKEEARPGMIINTLTTEVSKEIEILPVKFKREFLEWQPNRGGLVGRHSSASPRVLNAVPTQDDKGRTRLQPLGSPNTLQDTRQHYVLVKTTGHWQPAMLPMSSTQLKKSRTLMALIAEQQKEAKLMSFRLTTAAQSNDAGDWYGWKIEVADDYSHDSAVIESAVEFANALDSGRVEVDEAQFAIDNVSANEDDSDEIPF